MTRLRFLTLSLITFLFTAACAESATMVGGQNAAGGGAPGAAAAAVGGDPLAGAYMAGAGIGVSDLDKSQEFYTTIFGMALRYELPVPGYANERIMYFKDGQGSDVVLINFTDGSPHNYANNPA